jgi:hypothetical protein
MLLKGYEKRFVAFLDILGFKELIKKIEKENTESQDHERVTLILDFLYQESVESNTHHDLLIYEEVEDGLLEKELGDPRINYISDCVIISTEGTFEGFFALCNKVTKFSVQGASAGIYMRGGITYGNLYHHGPMLYGTAYQRALELEEQASDPRILIDDVVFDFLREHDGKFPLNEEGVREDVDGKKYLRNFPFGYESGFVTDWFEFLLRIKSCVLYFLNKFDGRVSGFGHDLRYLDTLHCWKEKFSWDLNFDGGSEKILKKYIWLKDEFNSVLRKHAWYVDASQRLRSNPHGVQEGPRILPIVWNGRIWSAERDLGRHR